ncbi:hypothetical protein Bbelb_308900 [Branchiostoma belcheri]|nr:hypothetical protein Bbelb_308900 [Branchiostoma belcheri]
MVCIMTQEKKEEGDKTHEYEHLKTVLTVAGYTKWAWKTPGRKKLTPDPRTHTDTRPKGHVTLPYIAGISEATRKIRKTGVAVHSRPQYHDQETPSGSQGQR